MHAAEHPVGARVHLNGTCNPQRRHEDDNKKQFEA